MNNEARLPPGFLLPVTILISPRRTAALVLFSGFVYPFFMKDLHFKNGDSMPALGLGTWRSEKNQVYHAVREAIRIGYRHFDCAFIYENEQEIGQALADAMAAGDVKREDLFITSKLWNDKHRREDVSRGCGKSLTDLKLDYLDLYLVHWPVALKPGVAFPESGHDMVSPEEIPLKETWLGMERLLAEGKVRHIGVSNFSTGKLKKLQAEAEHTPEVNQIEMHPLLQQQEIKSYCDAGGILLTAYCPLGTGKRSAGQDRPVLLENEVILRLAAAKKCTPAQLILAWGMERGTSVIPKSVNPGRLKENFEAATLRVTQEEMAEIAKLDRHFRFVEGTIWTSEGSPYTLADLWDEA